MRLLTLRHALDLGNEKGQVTAWFVGISLILFGMMAFTIDVGFWLVDRRAGQNQVDAAVLAGVQDLPNRDTAAAAAQKWLENNGGDESECTLETSPSEYTEVYNGFAFQQDEDGAYTKIRACLSREGQLFFSPILQLAGVEIRAVAAAGLTREPARYALMAMNDTTCAEAPTLNVRGEANVILADDGASYTALDCGATSTLRVDGNGELTASYHDFCGAAGTQGSNAVLVGDLHDQICQLPDPWVSYDQPNPGSCVSPGSISEPDFVFSNGEHKTLNPGTYCQIVALSGPDPTASSITLSSGTYVFRNGLMVTGGTLIGTDVVLYFTCDTGDDCDNSDRPRDLLDEQCSEPATFCVQGTANVDLSAPEEDPHIVVWVDRTAVAEGEELVRIAGQGVISIDGHIYAWPGEVEIQGTGSGLNLSLSGTILGDTIEMAGQGQYTIEWDEEFAPKIFTLSLIE